MVAQREFSGRGHIDINDDSEMSYWTHQLSVTPAQLFAAVCAVGTSTRLVIQYLGIASA
ncbi:DUF3606 domain-containing protein [Sphingomonas kyeonggiensis]|uniref:DUF3606 domain-containing protein n=1 Tax=Sphingomonas kyeonggiensis TaxID=1268553 RepID=UPI00358F004E